MRLYFVFFLQFLQFRFSEQNPSAVYFLIMSFCISTVLVLFPWLSFHLGLCPVCDRDVNCCRTYCAPPVLPYHGSYEPPKDKYQSTEEIIYSCASNTYLFGQKRRVCLENETWSGSPPYCVKSLSTMLQPLGQNSKIIKSVGSQCSDERNSFLVTFRYDGQFKSFIVRFTIPGNNTGSYILDLNKRLCNLTSSLTTESTRIEYNCSVMDIKRDSDTIQNITIVNLMKPFKICNVGIFTYADSVCSPLEMKQGNISLTYYPSTSEGAISYGTAVIHKCDEDYAIKGAPLRYCGESNQWTEVDVSCEPIDCGEYTNTTLMEHGFLTYTNKTYRGKVYLHCDQEFEVFDDQTSVCLKNSSWRYANFKCSRTFLSKNKTVVIAVTIGILFSVAIFFVICIIIIKTGSQFSKSVRKEPQQYGCDKNLYTDTHVYSTMCYEEVQIRKIKPLSPLPDLPTTEYTEPVDSKRESQVESYFYEDPVDKIPEENTQLLENHEEKLTNDKTEKSNLDISIPLNDNIFVSEQNKMYEVEQ